YSFLPSSVALHWNYLNVPDFYASKLWLFIFPVLMIISFFVMRKFPHIRGLKEAHEFVNYHYSEFVSFVILFLLYVEGVVLLSNLYFSAFSISDFILPAFSVFFYWSGSNMQKLKRNHWIGIRTPWTVKSDKVWKKTHEEGAKLFKVLSIIFMLSLFISNPAYQWMVALFSLIVVAVVLILFSFFDFQSKGLKAI
ncbi:MAG: SdpI family protein, partial [Candidatus Marsarchaeota archaeon]|nr:SdpI family protein [Candidatus Marsarchaeota archaeon]